MHRLSLYLLPLLLLITCLPLPGSAQGEKGASPASSVARRAMKPGGISLRYLSLPQGADGKRAWAHLSVVPPKGVSSEGTPFTRAYIEENIFPRPCLFYLDLFTPAGKGLQRRTTILFRQQAPPREIQTCWREPDKKRGLTLLLNFQIGNSGAWHVLPLDDQFRPLARQEFWFAYDTAEPDYRTDVLFGQTDARGLVKIGVLVSEGEKKQTLWYEWKENAFVDPAASYFVVAAVRKTRREAEAFVTRQELQEYEIVPTEEYKPLPSHAYAVVVKRLRDRKQAESYAKALSTGRKPNTKYTVVRAF